MARRNIREAQAVFRQLQPRGDRHGGRGQAAAVRIGDRHGSAHRSGDLLRDDDGQRSDQEIVEAMLVVEAAAATAETEVPSGLVGTAITGAEIHVAQHGDASHGDRQAVRAVDRDLDRAVRDAQEGDVGRGQNAAVIGHFDGFRAKLDQTHRQADVVVEFDAFLALPVQTSRGRKRDRTVVETRAIGP